MNTLNTGTRTAGVLNPVISSSRVEGTKVYNEQGEKLGSIDHLQIDKQSGQVRYAILEFGGFLGMGTDRYPLPWNVLRYDTALDGYVVPVTKDKLDNSPKYEGTAHPEYNDEYGRRVYDYYGAQW